MKNTRKSYLVILSVGLILVYGMFFAFALTKANDWRISEATKYLHKAEITDNLQDKFIFYEQAALLNANERTYLPAGITAAKLGDNKLAEKYLSRVKTANGYYELGNAYYSLEQYDRAATSYQKAIYIKRDQIFYAGLGKSFLKLGETEKAREALSKVTGLDTTQNLTELQRYLAPIETAELAIISYNGLNTLGYPQSAKKVLDEAISRGLTNRDSLNTLAEGQIEAGDYYTAESMLVRALALDGYYPQTYKQLIFVSEKLGKSDKAAEYQEALSRITWAIQ